MSGFLFSEQQGDLFECDQDFSLVHCVSADLRMGRGIAVEFKKRFGQLFELHRQKGRIGDALTLRRRVDEGGAWVYYLITKAVCYYKPRYTDLESSPPFHTINPITKHFNEPNIIHVRL